MPGQSKRTRVKKAKAVTSRPKVSNQLIHLSLEQQESPGLVLQELFDNYHLKDIREYLWDWLVAALASDNGTYQSGKARSNLLFLYENMLTLTEAAFLLNQQADTPSQMEQ